MWFFSISEKKYSVHIEKNSFLDIVKKSVEKINNIKINKYNVYNKNNSLFYEIEISLKNSLETSKIIKFLEEKIEELTYNLTSLKSKNIQIIIA